MNKKTLKTLGIISIPIMYIIFFLAVKCISFVHFSYDLLFFASISIIYVSLHFFFDIKKMYNFIFKYRYVFGVVIFAILVVGKYNGSSMTFWNNYINPEIRIDNDQPVLGIARGIRSDEWLVSTPYNLSQTDSQVNFNEINPLANAKDTKVSLYPRLIVKDYAIILHPNNWGFLFLPKENAFSFFWYFDMFVAFFVALELFMIFTKKNKLYSVLGTFLLVIAPPVYWWNSCSYILFGGLALLIINKFINTKNIKIRLLLSALLGYIGSCYISIMYPAWMIPYAYLFVMLFIWLLIENKDKIKWKDLLYLIITAIVCAGTFLPLYFNSREVYDIILNTVYPGARASYGGDGNWKLLFTYISTIFYPYTKIANPCEYCQYISLFPIPMFMSIYYLYKNKKENKKMDWFLLLLLIYSSFLTIWCIFPLPKFISKLTLLTMSTVDRTQLVVGFTNIFLLIYIMSRYEVKKEDSKLKKYILLISSILITLIVLLLSYRTVNTAFPNCIGKKMYALALLLFIPIFYFTIRNKKKTNFILFMLLLFVSLESSILIHPLNKGLNIFYKKPFAKEIQKLVKENKDSKFLTVDGGVIIQNYILANGGKSINSTNFVPNLELWHKLDKKKKYNNIYNRYSHVAVELTDEETSFELIQADAIKLNLNYNDICKTGATYLVSSKELEIKDEYYSEFYTESNLAIYKTTCE